MNNEFNPLVSIVIPVYNGSNYLREAIDSALDQTYKNIEIIVVNDGSIDGGKTEQIALSYGDKIRYLKKENGGVATALNLGIKEMKGEYFSWLSHDDLYLPEKIEKQIEFIAKNNIINENIIIASNYELINEKGKFLNCVKFNMSELNNRQRYFLLRGSINGITLLIPKRAFDEYGQFNVNLRCTQDYDMWHKMNKTYKFIGMNDILAKTRIHKNQDTNANPLVKSEGNILWCHMIESVSLDEKLTLEGSEYNFYKNMIIFLSDTPYDEANEMCKNKLREIENDIENVARDVLVTIIIPFYNRIALLEPSIKSVVKQSHKNIEILLIDDGSTEQLSDEIKILIKNDNRIKLIKLLNNNGVANARNVGISNAKGRFIAFLDSDDLYEEDKIFIQLKQMLLHNSKYSFTSYKRRHFDSNNKIILEETFDMAPFILNKAEMFVKRCPIATPTVMIERDIIISNNLFFDTSLSIGEDVCFWLNILKNNSFLIIREPLTTVITTNNSSAYNFNKQLIGLKNIITFALNDSYYKQFDEYIIELCNAYIYTFENIKRMNKNSLYSDNVEKDTKDMLVSIDTNYKQKIIQLKYQITRLRIENELHNKSKIYKMFFYMRYDWNKLKGAVKWRLANKPILYAFTKKIYIFLKNIKKYL